LGILAWQGQPLTLRVQRSSPEEPADIVVRWVEALGAMELGRAETEWSRSADGRTGMRVRSFTLALQNPFDASRPLEPMQVQLAAAHEMGHALGLPHSDSPRDVMYPSNTASSISPRDYETMAGLYRLENGAFLGPEALTGYR
ncbi:MAG TPA: matrixin family metalloprotease, partial [Longimicrobiales bacterium]|nr:matrixin family metalloprotease [Longimicrobiales bacterium]